jgi:hypothetical protein
VDVQQDLGVLRFDPARVVEEVLLIAVGAASQRVDVEDRPRDHHVRHDQAVAGKVERHAVAGVRPIGSHLHRLARNHDIENLSRLEEPARRLVARLGEQFLREEPHQARECVRTLRRVEDGELGDCPRHVEAALDAHALRRVAVAVEMFVAPDLGALVQPRSGAVCIVPVREQDRRDLDLPAERLLELLAHLGCGAGGVAGVHDDPTVRGFDGVAARDAPATEGIHTVGDLFGDGRLREPPQRVGFELRARRHGAVRCRDGFHGQRRAVPGSLRPVAQNGTIPDASSHLWR